MTVWDRSLLSFNSFGPYTQAEKTVQYRPGPNGSNDCSIWPKPSTIGLYKHELKWSSKNIGQFNLRRTYKIHNFDRSKTHVLTAHHKKYLSNPEHSNMEYLNIRTYERSNLWTNQLLNFSEHSNIEHLNIRTIDY